MFEKTFHTQSMNVYLIELDHSKETSKVLDKKAVEIGNGAKILLDQEDQQKFSIVYSVYPEKGGEDCPRKG